MKRKQPYFGPKVVQLFEVDIYSGEIRPYMASKSEALFELGNGNVFKTRKAAQDYVSDWLETQKNTLVDTTDWEEPDWNEEPEDGIPGSEEILCGEADDELLEILGIEDSVVAPPYPSHLRIKIAAAIAKAYAKNSRIKDPAKFVLVQCNLKEIDSVEAFLFWLDDNPSATVKMKLNKANLCNLYKNHFLEEV